MQSFPKGSPIPHTKAPANPWHWATIPTTGGLSSQEPSYLGSLALFPSGRGHHVPAPTWEGCRATLFSLRSCSVVPAGGCGVVGLCFVCFPFRGRRPKDRHFSRYPPLSSGSSVPCTRNPESAGHLVVYFVTGLMVGDRRFPGATMLGARFSTSSANHPVSVLPTGSEPRDGFSFWSLATSFLFDKTRSFRVRDCCHQTENPVTGGEDTGCTGEGVASTTEEMVELQNKFSREQWFGGSFSDRSRSYSSSS